MSELLLMVPRYCLVTFVRYFSSIDSLLSRSRELRADRVAAESFGTEPFRSALLKVTRNALFYQKDLEGLKAEGDFFAQVRERMQSSAPQLEARLAEEAGREEDVFDSHPSLAARIAAIPQAQPPAGGWAAMDLLREELSPILAKLSTRMNELLADGQNGGA